MTSTRRTARSTPVRMRAILAVVLLLLLGVAARLIWVQGIDPQDAKADALKGRTTSGVPIPATRGDILDADGKVLATSIVRYDLVVDQTHVEDSFPRKEGDQRVEVPTEQGIAEVAEVLGLDKESVSEALLGREGAEKRKYSVITRNITPKVNQQVEQVGVPWIKSVQTQQRSYPSGQLAGPVLGFLNREGEGAEGLELSQDKALTGQDGSKTYERGADGVRIPNAAVEETPAVNGQSVRLTLDSDIQWVAQNAVMAKKKEFKAGWVNAVVMDVKTGKILALADSDSMDPNDPGSADAAARTSSTVTQAYEPGSTGKAPTFALALEKGVISPTSEFKVPNNITLDKETINDSLKHGTYDMTAAGIFARSYNTGTVQIGDQLKDQDRYDFMNRLGIGKKIDIGLPGQNAGILAQPQDWERRQRLTTMFGQGYTQTTVHLASIYQALGNNGIQISPTLIDAYIDADGTEHEVEPAKTQRVISAKTSKEMRRLMEGVVDYGTSTLMQIDGYRVGGKSGTAQAQGTDGKFNQHTSSFIGMAPIDNPRYLVAVTMQHPQGYWRDWTVGDTFKKIMSASLSKNSVPPENSKSESYDGFVGENQKYGW
ncbi:MAG: peptidoglycan D,D-transpeptidase FtsI family protein [Galactobacter sp.]